MFGNQHMIALLFFLLFGIVLIKWAKNITTQKQNLALAKFFSLEPFDRITSQSNLKNSLKSPQLID